MNVKFNASPLNFLSLIILPAVFNVSVLGFEHVFLLKEQQRPLFIYLLPLRPVGKFQLQQYGGLECNKLYLASAIEDKLKSHNKALNRRSKRFSNSKIILRELFKNKLTKAHTRTDSKRKTSKRMNFPKVFIQPTFRSVFQRKLEQVFWSSRQVIAIKNHSLQKREKRYRW